MFLPFMSRMASRIRSRRSCVSAENEAVAVADIFRMNFIYMLKKKFTRLRTTGKLILKVAKTVPECERPDQSGG